MVTLTIDGMLADKDVPPTAAQRWMARHALAVRVVATSLALLTVCYAAVRTLGQGSDSWWIWLPALSLVATAVSMWLTTAEARRHQDQFDRRQGERPPAP